MGFPEGGGGNAGRGGGQETGLSEKGEKEGKSEGKRERKQKARSRRQEGWTNLNNLEEKGMGLVLLNRLWGRVAHSGRK